MLLRKPDVLRCGVCGCQLLCTRHLPKHGWIFMCAPWLWFAGFVVCWVWGRDLCAVRVWYACMLYNRKGPYHYDNKYQAYFLV